MATKSLTTFSTTDILEKEFRTELRGYSTNEVDEFLDEVIADYMKLYKEVDRLTAENTKLLSDLKRKATTEDGAQQIGAANYDVLKRVSLLEKQVAEIMNHLKKRAEQEKAQRSAETITPGTSTFSNVTTMVEKEVAQADPTNEKI